MTIRREEKRREAEGRYSTPERTTEAQERGEEKERTRVHGRI
jgi:hypothetical protein